MFRIQRQLLLPLSAGFVLTAIVGTLSHEAGHLLAARLMGLPATIHYGYTEYGEEGIGASQYVWLLLGGPLQTMLTGTIGLLLLKRSGAFRRNTESLAHRQWVFLFLALFWMREVMNAATWMIGYFLSGAFSLQGDEPEIALHFGWPVWSVVFVTALAGTIVCLLLFFRAVPKEQRASFLLAGILGGGAGYIGWLYVLGPLLLP